MQKDLLELVTIKSDARRKSGIEPNKTLCEILARKDSRSKDRSKRSKMGKYLSSDEATFDNQTKCDFMIEVEVDKNQIFTDEEIEEE